jgi:OmpA-OmpF porin, OOP family
MKNLIIIFILFISSFISAQESLTASEDSAMLAVTVTDMEKTIRPFDVILFEGIHTKKSFKGISDKNGKFRILLPEGDIYQIKIQGLGSQIDFDRLNIAKQEGIISGELAVRYRPEQKFTLDDVHFETSKSVLLPSSFHVLNELAAALKAKKDLKLEIAGHTDSVGNNDSNQKLSENRAKSVVAYLIKKGVEAARLIAKGYGEDEPIATNDTEEGRQENRRTEARIL